MTRKFLLERGIKAETADARKTGKVVLLYVTLKHANRVYVVCLLVEKERNMV